MNWSFWLPLVVLAISLLTALGIFVIPEQRSAWRTGVNLAGAVIKLVLVMVMVWGVFQGIAYEFRVPMGLGVDFTLKADELSVMFAGLSALLWFWTTVYAIGYLEGSAHRARFFGFFSLCVASTFGIALAGNLYTFFIFYEMLTLSTYPLLVHKGTAQALAAGRRYLIYTLLGGALLLAGIVWLHTLAGDLSFARGGNLGDTDLNPQALRWIFLLLITGLAVKAALVPFHGWLPGAMVAPAPVSALLHAVAVVKAGVFGIVRVIYDVFGITFSQALGVLFPLSIAASVTIIYGSLRALQQVDLKRRLAFSTVSQVSYITLGTTLFGPLGTIGALVHLLHQGLMKITLFFCAGNFAETIGAKRIDQLNGAGARMPLTSAAFTIGALGMMGAPPLAGFISKWYLGVGAIDAGMTWVLGVLVASTLLNAAYFLPILHRLWFRPAPAQWPREAFTQLPYETHLWLLMPPLFTAMTVILVGLLAGLPFSPLQWAYLVAAQEYVP